MEATEGRGRHQERPTGWRYQASDRRWHCFTQGEERSLCGAHALGWRGATAAREAVPVLARCRLCDAVCKRRADVEREKA